MNLLCNMSGESVFYYILNKDTEQKENVVEGAENIANDMKRMLSARK